MTKAEFREARRTLGMNTVELAAALGLGKHGKRTIERIEAGASITGPMALAVAKLVDNQSALNPGEPQ